MVNFNKANTFKRVQIFLNFEFYCLSAVEIIHELLNAFCSPLLGKGVVKDGSYYLAWSQCPGTAPKGEPGGVLSSPFSPNFKLLPTFIYIA